MLEPLDPVVFLVVGVVVVNGVAARIGLPAPILLVLAGFAASFIPAVPDFQLNPDLVLDVLLPPLLYAAAVEASVIAIRQLIVPIVQLAVGMVLVTALAVAFVTHWLMPDIPFPAALALGAIVAPPDAVAAVAVARRAGLPRRIVTVLEGESLFNDATSLVLLKVAIGGIAAGTMAWGKAAGEFVWATAGGLLVGVVVGLLVSVMRRKITGALPTTAISLVAPFIAHQIGDLILASGVLAVVVSGLVLGFRSPLDVQPQVRMTLHATWRTIQYVLEGVVFALIGLQLWGIVTAPDVGPGTVFMVAAAVLATVILVRPAWIFLTTTAIGGAWRGQAHWRHIGWRSQVAVSWAGMRGVVSLAAAQGLPLDVPHRNLLLTCTIVVIFGTLVLQGLTLPAVIRRLKLPAGPSLRSERRQARRRADRAIRGRAERIIAERRVSRTVAREMRYWVRFRNWVEKPEDHDGPNQVGTNVVQATGWRRELIGIERDVYISLRGTGEISEEVMADLQYGLDLEEALLERRADDATGHLDQIRAQRSTDDDAPGPDDDPEAVGNGDFDSTDLDFEDPGGLRDR